jgi:hypothetical protein
MYYIETTVGLEVTRYVTTYAHCWILLDCVIGAQLVEPNLGTFVKAVEKLWKENSAL